MHRHMNRVMLKFKLHQFRLEKKGYLSYFECGMFVGSRWVGLFQKLLINWDFPTHEYCS